MSDLESRPPNRDRLAGFEGMLFKILRGGRGVLVGLLPNESETFFSAGLFEQTMFW